MEGQALAVGSKVLVGLDGVQGILDALKARGFSVMGPTVRDAAIVYDRVARVEDFPVGWTDHQEPGRYRLERRADKALFGYVVGPQSWKRFLHPPVETIWTMRRDANGATIEPGEAGNEKFAFIGIRSCELHAIAIQDRVFVDGPYPDALYAARRRGAFFVAVNCAQPGGLCFCVSMDTGPKAKSGFDLALTELIDASRHEFLLEAGSVAGVEVLRSLPARAATKERIADAEAVVARTAGKMGRKLETAGLKELLQGHLDHPRWDEVAERCLTCGNCTMVCPTCFCTTVEDHSDLTQTSAERVRKWDSCFTMDFSYVHGGSVRHTTRSRYRQWMTHKLANWIDQFGTSGCVGCGRCIAWCPVGIDITEEAAAIRANPQRKRGKADGGA